MGQITEEELDKRWELMRHRGRVYITNVAWGLFGSISIRVVRIIVHRWLPLNLSYNRGYMGTVQINADLEKIWRSVRNGLKKVISAMCTVLHLGPQNVIQSLGDVLAGESLVHTLGVVLNDHNQWACHTLD